MSPSVASPAQIGATVPRAAGVESPGSAATLPWPWKGAPAGADSPAATPTVRLEGPAPDWDGLARRVRAEQWTGRQLSATPPGPVAALEDVPAEATPARPEGVARRPRGCPVVPCPLAPESEVRGPAPRVEPARGPSYPARLARALGSRSGATNRRELSSPCRSRRPPALSVIPSGPGRRSPRSRANGDSTRNRRPSVGDGG